MRCGPPRLPEVKPTPQSISFTWSSAMSEKQKHMFSGFRSLCAMPLPWAYRSALATCRRITMLTLSVSRSSRQMRSYTSPPSQYSMTRYTVRPWS